MVGQVSHTEIKNTNKKNILNHVSFSLVRDVIWTCLTVNDHDWL